MAKKISINILKQISKINSLFFGGKNKSPLKIGEGINIRMVADHNTAGLTFS